MAGSGIPLDKAELLSVLLEGMLYGVSLLMFCGTIWALLSLRSAGHLNRAMLAIACLLLLFSTTHFVINIIRIMEGFIFYRDTYSGGPTGYFSDVSQWTFVYMNYVFTAQTLLGDGVVIYRCYAVWQSKRIIVLPVLLWCAVCVTGVGAPYTLSQVTQDEVFGGRVSQWITSFWATTLSANMLTTLLLACRIWYVNTKATGVHAAGKSPQWLILRIVVDAGVFYPITLLVGLICFVAQSNFQYTVLSMVTPVISITFYMVMVRVGLANRAKRTTDIPLTSTEISLSAERRRGMQVRITTFTENNVDNGHRLAKMPADNDHHQSEKVNSVGGDM